MKYKLLYFIVIFFAVSLYLYAEVKYEKEAAESAKKNLGFLLKQIPEGKETAFGFDNKEELKRINLGKPYQVLEVDKIQKKISRKSLVEADEWRVPMIVDGKIKGMINIKKNNGYFDAIKIGGGSIAKELNEVLKNIKDSKSDRGILIMPNSKAYYLVIYDKKKDFTKASYYFLNLYNQPDAVMLKNKPLKLNDILGSAQGKSDDKPVKKSGKKINSKKVK